MRAHIHGEQLAKIRKGFNEKNRFFAPLLHALHAQVVHAATLVLNAPRYLDSKQFEQRYHFMTHVILQGRMVQFLFAEKTREQQVLKYIEYLDNPLFGGNKRCADVIDGALVKTRSYKIFYRVLDTLLLHREQLVLIELTGMPVAARVFGILHSISL
jgi:hypothetical protein